MAQNCKTSSYKKVLHPSKPHQILEGCYAPAYIDTVWKNAKFTLIEKIFRQINSLVISLVKTLISRKICQ